MAAALRERLAVGRAKKKWSLRDVERRTGIHNAHLSQIRRQGIERPEPYRCHAVLCHRQGSIRSHRRSRHSRPGARNARAAVDKGGGPNGPAAYRVLGSIVNTSAASGLVAACVPASIGMGSMPGCRGCPERTELIFDARTYQLIGVDNVTGQAPDALHPPGRDRVAAVRPTGRCRPPPPP